ncbi:MAG: TlpA disulfide reductase family protein [Spirochaetaceae bacterium]
MNRFNMRIFVSVFVIALVAGAATPATADDALARFAELGLNTPGERVEAQDFELPGLHADGTRSLSSFEGDVVLLNFWASWCPPCIEEMPSMQALYKRLGGDGFEIVAVNLQEERDTVRTFMEENGFAFPVLLDRRGSVGREYNVRGIPTSYIIDAQGRMVAVMIGPYQWDDPEMVAALEDLRP